MMRATFNSYFVTPLFDPSLVSRRHALVTDLLKEVVEIRELSDGYAFKCSCSEPATQRMADYILFESEHSPGLTFEIVVEADRLACWLQVRSDVTGGLPGSELRSAPR